MFNDKASDKDRQRKLEDLIRKDYQEECEEDNSEILNDQ